MKKHQPTSRLTLSRETVRWLGGDALSQLIGGDDVPKTFTKRKGTCTSCDGPVSCRLACVDTKLTPDLP